MPHDDQTVQRFIELRAQTYAARASCVARSSRPSPGSPTRNTTIMSRTGRVEQVDEPHLTSQKSKMGKAKVKPR